MDLVRRTVIGAALATLAAPGLAQRDGQGSTRSREWPTPRVVLTVSASAGGSADVLGRVLAEALQPVLGRPVVVENRGGSGGMLAAEAAVRAPADGSVFLLSATPLAILPALLPRMPYDTERDLVPVTRIALVPHMVIASAKGPSRTLRDLVERARTGSVNYATGGAGTAHHLGAEAFARSAGVTMTPVHYRGSGPAMSDLISDNVQVMFESMPSAAAQIRAGTVRPLAITAERRSPDFPDVPTVAEAGFPPLELTTWYAVWGPRDLSPALAARMAGALRAAQGNEKVRAAFVLAGAEPATDTPAEFAAFFTRERARWAEVVRVTGVTLE